MREKPNITTHANKACIMFSHNKTFTWLDTKSPARKARTFKKARHSVKIFGKNSRAVSRKLKMPDLLLFWRS